MSSDPEDRAERRRNFIKTIDEIEQIAEACGETGAQYVLMLLKATLKAGVEIALVGYLYNFNVELIKFCEARKNKTGA